jgi:hypothetical protein
MKKMESGTDIIKLDESDFDVLDTDMVIVDPEAQKNTSVKTQDTMAATTTEDQPGQLQCCPISETTPVPTEEVTELATVVASLVSEYKDLDAEISGVTTDLLDQAIKFEQSKGKLSLKIAHMHSVLSQRGDLHRYLTGDELPPEIAKELLAQVNALPGWVEWYEVYRARVKNAASLRTVQRQIAELNRMSLVEHTEGDENSDGAECSDGVDDGESPEENSGRRDDVIHGIKESERDDIMTGQELLSEFAKKMLEVLIGKSIKSEAMRIKGAVEMVKNLQRAIDEGKLIDSEPCGAVLPSPPQQPITGTPVPESNPAEGKIIPHDPAAPVDEPDKPPVSEADDAVQCSVTEYCGEFAIWVEPRKQGDIPYDILPTHEEAKARVEIFSAGGSIGGMAPRKRPASVKISTVSSPLAVNDVPVRQFLH